MNINGAIAVFLEYLEYLDHLVGLDLLKFLMNPKCLQYHHLMYLKNLMYLMYQHHL